MHVYMPCLREHREIAGDSDPGPVPGLAAKGIDVAFVPLWLFHQANAKDVLDKHVGARRLVVMRLPLDGLKKIEADFKRRFPGVAFLTKPMATVRL